MTFAEFGCYQADAIDCSALDFQRYVWYVREVLDLSTRPTCYFIPHETGPPGRRVLVGHDEHEKGGGAFGRWGDQIANAIFYVVLRVVLVVFFEGRAIVGSR